jgi:hypothetical protein
MSAHTPGPWECRETGTWPETNHHLGIYSDNHPTGRIALVEGFYAESANAKLIAAAPDLLAALNAIVRAYDGPTVGIGAAVSSHISAARAAIAKAEGR